jgi:hypothetical protein
MLPYPREIPAFFACKTNTRTHNTKKYKFIEFSKCSLSYIICYAQRIFLLVRKGRNSRIVQSDPLENLLGGRGRIQCDNSTEFNSKGKGKVFPLRTWAGPWGSGRLWLRIFSTSGTIKVVRSSPLRTGRLYPQEFSWYSFLEAESTPWHMVPSVATKKSPTTPLGIDSETFRLAAQCLNHYAIPGLF